MAKEGECFSKYHAAPEKSLQNELSSKPLFWNMFFEISLAGKGLKTAPG